MMIEIITSCCLVAGCSYVLAALINFSEKSVEEAAKRKAEEARKLHLSALLGYDYSKDHEAIIKKRMNK